MGFSQQDLDISLLGPALLWGRVMAAPSPARPSVPGSFLESTEVAALQRQFPR